MFSHFKRFSLVKLNILFFSILGLFAFVLGSCNSDDTPDNPSGPGDFVTQAGASQISGTLFLPEGDGPFPVIIIVPGSGVEPKEDSYGFNDIFLPNGFAIYHYDKRGIGTSTGSYPAETLETPQTFLNARADDVLGIVDLLVQHEDIRNDAIGLMGASQGGWVNVLVYDRTNDVDFAIMVNGGAAPTRIEHLYDNLLTDNPDMTIDEAMEQVNAYSGPLGYNPLPSIESMPFPVVWVYGWQDRSHPVRYDVPALEAMNKSNFTISIFQNSDHEMVDITTGQFDPNLFPSLLQWLDENAR